MNPLLSSQILIGSVTRQDFDVDYLYTLERLFIANLDQADGPTICSMIAGHSDWAQGVL